MAAYGLKQHVNIATHSYGHTLDLVITAEDMDLQSHTQHDVYSLSDHMCLQFILSHGSMTAKPMDYVSRDWSALDRDLFQEELANTDLADMHPDDVDSIFCV